MLYYENKKKIGPAKNWKHNCEDNKWGLTWNAGY